MVKREVAEYSGRMGLVERRGRDWGKVVLAWLIEWRPVEGDLGR